MNLRSGIGWRFPPLNGGEGQGFEHAGMAHFQGDLLGCLAREVIQNSLDARLADSKPVEVTFEMKDINLHRHLGGDELRRHILACGEAATGEKPKRFFADAASLLDAEAIPCLGISDGNTTGLGEKQWRALVKMQGDSAKRDSISGGSFGIGKNAPFAVSPLRTVCYWTCATNGRKNIEKFQAKAILMSHDWPVNGSVEATQGAGYYGLVEACSEIRPPRVPSVFRNLNDRSEPVGGTTVWITGFRTDGAWQRQIARSVIANYFYAIDHDRLDVLIDPDDSPEEPTTSLVKGSLKGAFDYLTSEMAADRDLEDAYTFWRVQHEKDPTFEKDLGDLGLVRLWIEVGEDLPRKVALIRGTGMLITDNQRGLMRFRDLLGFAAVCVFESDEANELLRQMENPAHDQFEPERLPEQQRQRGREALASVVKWIREKLKEVATLPRPEGGVDLVELRRFLPDSDAPGPLAGSDREDRREKAFGKPGAVLRRAPRRRVRPSRLPTEAEEEVAGEGVGHEGGAPINPIGGGRGGGSGGSGDGDGRGGTGSRGGGPGRGIPAMRDVRVLPTDGDEARVRVAFTPEASGRVRLSLETAGDSVALPIPGVRLFDEDDHEITKEGIVVEADTRRSVFASADRPLVGMAVRLTASEDLDP